MMVRATVMRVKQKMVIEAQGCVNREASIRHFVCILWYEGRNLHLFDGGMKYFRSDCDFTTCGVGFTGIRIWVSCI